MMVQESHTFCSLWNKQGKKFQVQQKSVNPKCTESGRCWVTEYSEVWDATYTD